MTIPEERTFDAVIFDMDGTLIDSTAAVERAWTAWAKEEGVTAEALAGQHGVPSEDVVRAVLPPHRHDAAIERINALELADVWGIVPLPGATETLQALPADQVAIATSCSAPLAKARLSASGLRPPQVVITADDVERGKPAPDPYRTAAGWLGADPQRCLVVEDAPKGVLAARAAGSATLAVLTTTPATDLDADLRVPDLSQVEWLVERAGTQEDAPSDIRLRIAG